MRDILIQQWLHRAHVGVTTKPTPWSDADRKGYDLQACNTIRLNLAQNVVYYVMNETSALSK